MTLNKWQKEFEKWFPDCRVFKFYGDHDEKQEMKSSTLKQGEFDVILTTFEVAMKEKYALSKLKFDYLILDEAHRIKNDQCVLSQSLR